jgi:alanine racemase
MSDRLRETYAEIDLKAIEHNLTALKSCLKENKFICPMVKADAYGHGDIEVAKILEKNKVPAVGVVLIEEAVRLREAGIKLPILVFGHFENRSAEIIIKNGLTPVFSTWDHIKSLERIVPENSGYPIHLKFNTNMSRLGFSTHEAHELAKYDSLWG